jgi:transcriptional regulator
MYSFPAFTEKDQSVVLKLIHDFPFAVIIGTGDDNFPVATQLPLLVRYKNEKLYLYGHMMKNSDHYDAFLKNPNVLALFTGPYTYVSASWYSSPFQGSTFNYMTVHAKGKISFLNYDELVEILRKTSLYFEDNNPDSPTVYDNLPEDYRTNLLQYIAAFEIEVFNLENIFKLSQNQDETTYLNIIEKLKLKNEAANHIANEMELRKASLF